MDSGSNPEFTFAQSWCNLGVKLLHPIAAHLLSPRMSGAEVFAIESINETASGLGIDVETIKGEKFRDLFKKLLSLNDAIIDVGASNVEAFLNGMIKAEDSHLEFDLFF